MVVLVYHNRKLSDERAVISKMLHAWCESFPSVLPTRMTDGEAAMAARENQGDLWDLTWRLVLQLPIECAGFRTLSLASVQILGCSDACLMKVALDRT